MKSNKSVSPAFGEASLSNCEREQIHLPGSIQPHGALLVLRESDLGILQASTNAAAFLGVGSKGSIGNLQQINSSLADKIRSHLDRPLSEVPAHFRCAAGVDQQLFDCLLHRSDDNLVIEFLHAGSAQGLSDFVQGAMRGMHNSRSLQETCAKAADLFSSLTGYDRVMVYQFDDEGHGQVVAETFEKDLEPFLGTRYPASDIPQIARRLYLQNRIRMLADVGYTPVRIEPRLLPSSGRELDMSMCFLRSISPIHVQYLKNMGVAATLVISIVVGGELWGLVACHHYSPYLIDSGICAACEFLAETISVRIAEFEALTDVQADLAVRRFETHVAGSISRYGDWKSGLFDGSRYLLQPMDAGGAALYIDNEFFTTGEVPGTQELRQLREWLEERVDDDVYYTASLGIEDQRFAGLTAVASGLVAVRISQTPGELLMWFRPQQLRTDIWGGDPAKAVRMGDDPADLSPRRSFAKWYQQVEGTSVPWSSATVYIAKRIGQSVGDAVLHNRSVRALIAEDQLNKAIRQVGASDLPVVITDTRRKILLANEAFHSLLPPGVPHLDRLEDLPNLFADPDGFRKSLTDLCDRQIAWRGEVSLVQAQGGTVQLLLRADPVQIPPNRVLGFLLMFMDMTEYRAVDDARRRFQDLIISESSLITNQARSDLGLLQRNLFSTVVGNAQHAALEISNGVDVARIPEMLESVRSSVGRSAKLLKRLMDYAADDKIGSDSD